MRTAVAAILPARTCAGIEDRYEAVMTERGRAWAARHVPEVPPQLLN